MQEKSNRRKKLEGNKFRRVDNILLLFRNPLVHLLQVGNRIRRSDTLFRQRLRFMLEFLQLQFRVRDLLSLGLDGYVKFAKLVVETCKYCAFFLELPQSLGVCSLHKRISIVLILTRENSVENRAYFALSQLLH